MATYDLTQGGAGAVPGHQPPAAVFIEGIVDLSKVNAGAGAAQNDVLQVLHVPANTEILGVFYQVAAKSANAGTFNLGDGADADRYVAAAAANALGDGYGAVRNFYTAADTIDLVQTAVLTVSTGVIKVMALAVHFEPSTHINRS